MGALRSGYTTGTCAAAAANAAVMCLVGQPEPEEVELLLPDGSRVTLPLVYVRKRREGAEAAARKDAGDDPDVTDGTTVVDRLNLSIHEGELFGFLGPNGAGKTTTILMLLGLTEPTSGTAYVDGHNATRDPLEVKRITGYIPEHVGFYEDLTATQNLAYTARLNGLPESVVTARISESLNTVGLSKSADQKVQE